MRIFNWSLILDFIIMLLSDLKHRWMTNQTKTEGLNLNFLKWLWCRNVLFFLWHLFVTARVCLLGWIWFNIQSSFIIRPPPYIFSLLLYILIITFLPYYFFFRGATPRVKDKRWYAFGVPPQKKIFRRIFLESEYFNFLPGDQSLYVAFTIAYLYNLNHISFLKHIIFFQGYFHYKFS